MSFADILQKIDSGQSKKLSAKVPQWAGVSIKIPSSLNLEQCSSSATAGYKATLASSEGATLRLADLTGGLGVDSFFFSRLFQEVLHNERDLALSEAVRANFSALGVTNVKFSSYDAQSAQMLETLRTFRPDVIYIDPARRSEAGRKVFLLEECSPNVLELLPSLLELCSCVLLKLSPMADVSMLRKRMTPSLESVHIVESAGECKELLCVLRSSPSPFKIVVTDLRDSFSFCPEDEAQAVPVLWSSGGELPPSYASGTLPFAPGTLLFEPGPALMKSGAYKLICSRLSLKMISAESHLYAALSDRGSLPLGKTFRIIETVPFNGRNIKMIGGKYPCAELTAKGIHMKTEELRQRMGLRSGNGIHIFGTPVGDEKFLIVTEPLNSL